jgi:hypothetical protein
MINNDRLVKIDNPLMLRALAGNPAMVSCESNKLDEPDGHKFKVGEQLFLTGLEDFPEFNGSTVTVTAYREPGARGRAYYIKGTINHYCNWVYEHRLTRSRRQSEEKTMTGLSPAAKAALDKGDVVNFLVAITPGGIEAQEKRGQVAQAVVSTLPRKGTHDRAPWEALGFKFGAVDNNSDKLFVEVEFPPGWYKRPTDHSLWTDVIDDKGRKRASIFYKAAFHDCDAFVRLEEEPEAEPGS